MILYDGLFGRNDKTAILPSGVFKKSMPRIKLRGDSAPNIQNIAVAVLRKFQG